MKKFINYLTIIFILIVCISLYGCNSNSYKFTYKFNDNNEYVITGYKNEEKIINLVIPDSYKNVNVIGIDKNAFSGTKIETVTLGENIRWIDTKAFSDCKNLKSVKLNDNLTIISTSCFENCTNLESIFIPKSVKVINDYVFADCTSLKKIEFDSAIDGGFYTLRTGNSVLTNSTEVFKNCPNLLTFIAPKKLYFSADVFFSSSVLNIYCYSTTITGKTSYTQLGINIYAANEWQLNENNEPVLK